MGKSFSKWCVWKFKRRLIIEVHYIYRARMILAWKITWTINFYVPDSPAGSDAIITWEPDDHCRLYTLLENIQWKLNNRSRIAVLCSNNRSWMVYLPVRWKRRGHWGFCQEPRRTFLPLPNSAIASCLHLRLRFYDFLGFNLSEEIESSAVKSPADRDSTVRQYPRELVITASNEDWLLIRVRSLVAIRKAEAGDRERYDSRF